MELLEAEIRRTEDALHLAQSNSTDLETQLTVARRETELLRTQMASTGGQAPLPEQTGNLVRLSGVKINSLLSGGKDRDGQPGDDVLVALVSPLDEQGELVKIAGEVEIEAYDMTLPGEDKRVGRWTFSSEEAAKAWHSGFVGAGLQFELPWQVLPNAKELVVHARLRTVDGRQFDTSTPLRIDPAEALAPGLLQPFEAQPVKHEKTGLAEQSIETAVQLLPEKPQADPSITRPVPLYDDVDAAPSNRPFPPKARPSQVKRKTTTPAGKATLDGTQTSDNWTDETIPRLR